MRIAMAQIRVEPGERDRNIARACAAIEEAKALGAGLVVLPECLDLGWTHPSARALAEHIPGPGSAQIANAAFDCSVYVAAGLAERDGDTIYNAAILIDSAGEIILRHRKINILDIARDLYMVGDRMAVAQTPFGTVALTVCADNFPETLDIAQSLIRMGADLILSPCAWAVPADHDNEAEPYGDLWHGAYGTLTREHDVTIVGVSNVGPITTGPWAGRKCIGCSMAMGPGGEIIAQAPYGDNAEAIVLFDV